ncbi:MAG: hypothetical protein R3E86_12560 [Pseudomonadales bacterium]
MTFLGGAIGFRYRIEAPTFTLVVNRNICAKERENHVSRRLGNAQGELSEPPQLLVGDGYRI